MRHKTCVDCGDAYSVGREPFQIDEWLCRECQKVPAVQVRVLLMRARAQAFDFERAWEFTLGVLPGDVPQAGGRVRWPHDTDHRREWKAVFADAKTVESWRSAYLREAPAESERPLALLVAA